MIFPVQKSNKKLLKTVRLDWTANSKTLTKRLTNIVAAFRGMQVSPGKHSYAWLPRKCDYRTDARTHGQTDRQTPDKVIPMCRYALQATQKFRGMHMSPAKHSYVWLPRKCDYRTDTPTDWQTDRQTDTGQSDPYVPLCFAGNTKMSEWDRKTDGHRSIGRNCYAVWQNMNKINPQDGVSAC